ncbi:NAD-dependent epimerase/dehydratase family protein [Vibrio splendidus]
MKILLTGSTGFVGQHLVGNGVGFRLVVRDESIPTSDSDSDRFFINNLDGFTSWNGAFDGIDSIIHLAGLAHSKSFTSHDYQSVNVEGTLHLASEAARAGIKRFIFVSSIVVNGTSTFDMPFFPTSKPNPKNDYARSKYDAELGLKNIAFESGMELVIIRPTLVYGLNAPGNFGLLTRLVTYLPFLPFRLVNNRRDFISVQNLADLLITCAKHPDASGHTFLASDSEPVSIRELTNHIGKGLGSKMIQLPVPESFMRFVISHVFNPEMAEHLFGNLEVDSSNAQDVLGWVPPYTMEHAMTLLSKREIQ